MKRVLLFFVVVNCTAFAQISINSSDIANYLAIGNTVDIHTDTITTTIDIGTPGGGNNWNFSGLQISPLIQISNESVDPATSPYSGDFPGADICIRSNGVAYGISSEIYSYLTLDGSALSSMGNGSTSSALPGFVNIITFDPDMISASLPQTFNTFWTESYTQTIVSKLNGTPVSSIMQNVMRDVFVDAYGSMTLPGGVTLEALRMEDVWTIVTEDAPVTSHSFTFVTKSGAEVNIPVEETSGNSGVVNVLTDGQISWNVGLSSDVEQISTLPEDFALSQNFPNPFNPTTLIEYSIPEASFVELKVYDVLGTEVATLVNEEQSAGIYRADFSGSDLASGLYIAKITAGNYTNTIKMSLLK